MRPADATGRVLGRYTIHSIVGQGGMATVYLGHQRGDAMFRRVVAVKALHSHLIADAEFSTMFIDEARLAARVRHPNVVATIDVVEVDGELLQVLEWVDGESLARLAPTNAGKDRALVPLGIVGAVMNGVLTGLHAAHEAKDERGELLGLVHRDVSPQNIMVGAHDGVARVLDFGIAKAKGRLTTTKDGSVRGKLSYMPPEQLRGEPASRANDIYAAGVVLWELLTGLPMIEPGDDGAVVTQVLTGIVEPPSVYRRECSSELDDLVLKAVHRDRRERFATARDMAIELQALLPPATTFEVSEWVQCTAKEALARRAQMVEIIEQHAARAGEPARDGARVRSQSPVGEGSEARIVTAHPQELLAGLAAPELTVEKATATNVHEPRSSRSPRRGALAIAGLTLVLGGIGVALSREPRAPDARPAAAREVTTEAATLPTPPRASEAPAAPRSAASAMEVAAPPLAAAATASAPTRRPTVIHGGPRAAASATIQGTKARDGTEDWK